MFFAQKPHQGDGMKKNRLFVLMFLVCGLLTVLFARSLQTEVEEEKMYWGSDVPKGWNSMSSGGTARMSA